MMPSRDQRLMRKPGCRAINPAFSMNNLQYLQSDAVKRPAPHAETRMSRNPPSLLNNEQPSCVLSSVAQRNPHCGNREHQEEVLNWIRVPCWQLAYQDDYINDFILPRKMIYCYINDIIAIQCAIQYTM